MATLVAALTWVPQGFAAEEPKKYVLDDKEFERISRLAQLQLNDARDEDPEALEVDTEETSGIAGNPQEGENDELKEYNLDAYDDESAEEEEKEGADFGIFSNVKGLSYYANDEEDPYITLKDVSSSKVTFNEQEAAVSEDEREELQILPSDNLVVAAKTEDEVSYLEVYVYEASEDNIYVHHDIMLPSLPLCVEWLNYNVNTSAEDNGTRRGNMVAVGTFDPDIEVWDLDLVEGMYPDAILGAAADKSAELPSPAKKGKKKKKKRQKVANDKFHVDAVMCLSANRLQRNLLLSGSADSTIKLWDLTAGSSSSCVKSYSSHKDKVSAIQWHPTEAFYALSGSYDRIVTVMDFRTANGTGANWNFDSDIEGVRWDPHDPNYFYVSTDNGILHNYDVRMHSTTKQKPVWLLQAHDSTISTFDISPTHPGIIVTGSTDQTVKLWHVAPSSKGPSMVLSRDLDLGKIFTTQFGPDPEVAMRVAVAGSAGSIKVWDLSTSNAARKAFGVSGRSKEIVEEGKVVGVSEDNDGESEGEDEQADDWEEMDDQ